MKNTVPSLVAAALAEDASQEDNKPKKVIINHQKSRKHSVKLLRLEQPPHFKFLTNPSHVLLVRKRLILSFNQQRRNSKQFYKKLKSEGAPVSLRVTPRHHLRAEVSKIPMGNNLACKIVESLFRIDTWQ
mmetsp:Transcript_2675/g.3991  ORF Transcript_2675/g.3991 Transcript_2675/m.3991 type:complete len:130 (-) Transcript_2675:1133-1522(-)